MALAQEAKRDMLARAQSMFLALRILSRNSIVRDHEIEADI
jgi:hypothetical protein